MDDTVLVRNLFSKRHILLNNEWECEAIRFVKLNMFKVKKGLPDDFSVDEAVFEQFLYSDLNESYCPNLKIPPVCKKITIAKPALFQVEYILDVTESTYNQYRIAKAGQQCDDDAEYKDPSDVIPESVSSVTGNRVLHVALTDGELNLTAVVTSAIPGLGLTTLPGTKLLLIPRIICRRRCVHLNQSNCQVLGGLCERLLEGNWPVSKVLTRLLKIVDPISTANVPSSVVPKNEPGKRKSTSNRVEDTRQTKIDSFVQKIVNTGTTVIAPPKSKPAKAKVKAAPSDCGNIADVVTTVITPPRSKMGKEQGEINPFDVQKIVNNNHGTSVIPPPRFKPALNKEEPNPFDVQKIVNNKVAAVPALARSKPTKDMEEDNPFDVQKIVNNIRKTLAITPPILEKSKQREEANLTTVHKMMNNNVKKTLGVILPVNLFEKSAEKGEDNPLDGQKVVNNKRTLTITPPRFKKAKGTEEAHPIVNSFIKLNIVKLADAMANKKYFLVPEVKLIMPIVCRSADVVAVKNDSWLYYVVVSDPSLSGVKMVMDPDVIEKLLGFTVAQAKKAAEDADAPSKEKFRTSVNRVFKMFNTRLDFIFHVEFSPESEYPPIIKKVETLAKSLEIF